MDWLFSLLGGIPILRAKGLDRQANRGTRDLFINGTMPLIIAPGGATNGYSEVVSTLEPGTAQMGRWCLKDLQKHKRSEGVVTITTSVQYYYASIPWKELDWLLSQLEADCGLPVESIGQSASETHHNIFDQRLLKLGEYVIIQMEGLYRDHYNYHFPQTQPGVTTAEVLVSRLTGDKIVHGYMSQESEKIK
ncbi:hypothetical protein RintRC_0668 [Richelia intracellularis]|nr:hypothetical protein RintRC_0668 [Richelia intracellularis]